MSEHVRVEKDGGVLSRVGVVDYSIGKGVAPGVFVVADMSHPRISERMEDLKMGKVPVLERAENLPATICRLTQAGHKRNQFRFRELQ